MEGLGAGCSWVWGLGCEEDAWWAYLKDLEICAAQIAVEVAGYARHAHDLRTGFGRLMPVAGSAKSAEQQSRSSVGDQYRDSFQSTRQRKRLSMS